VCEPTPPALAGALDRLWDDRQRTREMGEAGRDRYRTLDISWPRVVGRMVA